eukprot:5982995-Amphidinium_carterae.1
MGSGSGKFTREKCAAPLLKKREGQDCPMAAAQEATTLKQSSTGNSNSVHYHSTAFDFRPDE